MAVKKVSKPATTAKEVTKKEVAKKATPAPAPKKEVAKKATPAPAKKEAPKKETTKGGKVNLFGGKKTTKSFDIKPGSQATQEAFTDRFFNKLNEIGFEGTKEQVRKIQKAYSETLREVTDIASFADTTAGIYYGRRLIKTRVTQPPKAADGLETLMLNHYELKVRKLLGNEEDIKFFGHLSAKDDNIFEAVVDGKKVKINIAEAEAKELAKFGVTPATDDSDDEDEEEEEVVKKPAKKVVAKKPAKKVEEPEEDEDDEDIEDEDIEDEDEDSEDEDDSDEDEDEDEDDLFDDDEE